MELENKIVRAWNSFFERNGIDAVAYRVKQHKYTSQIVDILVDSRLRKYYLAIEAKSISVARGQKSIYFTQHFSVDRDGRHQIERISEFLSRSGRRGFLAVELRMGRGKHNELFIIKWRDIQKRYEEGKGFRVDEIMRYPKFGKVSGEYEISDDVIRALR